MSRVAIKREKILLLNHEELNENYLKIHYHAVKERIEDWFSDKHLRL